jgi:hypothetical protein
MKSPVTSRLLVCLAFGMRCFSPLEANEEAANSVKAFREKIAPATVAPAESAAAREMQIRQRIGSRLKMVEAVLARDEFDRLAELVHGVDRGDMPPEFQAEWLGISESLLGASEKMKAAAREQWYKEVDALVKMTRDTCLSAGKSGDMDPLILRVAALQMQRLGSETIVGQRAAEKLSGVTTAVQTWTHFLDFRDAGNSKAANDVLQNFSRNSSQFPVLTAADIQSRLLPIEEEKKASFATLQRFVTELANPADLEAALGRWKELRLDLKTPEGTSYEGEKRKLEVISGAWKAAARGENETALRMVESVSWGSGFDGLVAKEDTLREQVLRRVVMNMSARWAVSPLGATEGLQTYLLRVLDHLQSNADFGAMADVMGLYDRMGNPSGRTDSLARDRSTIERFLAGRRLEAAGDPMLAAIEYRTVLTTGGGKYVPLKEAGEAIQRLKEKTPEVLKETDATIIAELRSLRQQIQALQLRLSSGRVYPQ